MKTARQDRPAPSTNDTMSPNSATIAVANVYVDICARARVRFSCSNEELPKLTQTLQSMGLELIDGRAEPLACLMHINVAQHLAPIRHENRRLRDDVLVEPTTLWLLDQTGTAVAGLPFATWDTQITAQVIPSRVNWLLRLLLPIALPTKGMLTGHGAAYRATNGRGVVMCGLPHSGKTGATLAAALHGAKFLADDLVVIDPTQRQIEATTLPIEVAYSYLQQFPQYKEQVPKKTLTKLQGKSRALKVLRSLVPASLATKLLPGRIAKRWLNLLNTRLIVELPVSALFSADQLTQSAELTDLVVLIANQTTFSAEGNTQPISPEATTRRWSLAVKRDTSELCGLFDLFQFAYPDTRCDTLTDHSARVTQLLSELLAAQSEKPDVTQIRTHALTVNWHQPNPNLMYAGLSEMNNRD